MIKLIRCDDRMIHGQCIVRILSDFKINRIIGIDDFTAGNAMLKKIYQLAVPPGVQGGVYSEEEALEEIKNHLDDNEVVLILMKSPLSAPKLFDTIDALPKELNIGPMSSRKDTAKVTLYAYLTAEEISALNKLKEAGIRVYFNQVIDQKIDEWSQLADNFR